MISRRQLFKKAAAALAGIPFLGVLKPSEPPAEAKATPRTPKVLTSGFVQHGAIRHQSGNHFVLDGNRQTYYAVNCYESNGIVYNVESGKPIRVK